jgi:Zn-dependent protease with chaperone function
MQAQEAANAPRSAITALPPSYTRQAWLAVAALLGFVVAYFGLAGWFLFTAWRLSFGSGSGGSDAVWSFIVAICAAFLAVMMIKAVFFIQRGQLEGLTELKPSEEPRLFAFLHELADQAGAPRPHKVFVSARVNAAVFYDLSLLNLLMPSRKNLEIGLGLVNTLTLGEMRAVLAHEFGHFAQRSMAVGRWVYVAHQIAANMIARRDKLDAFLVGLSRFDIRFAWVGWLLLAIVWSIRSLVASVFQGVLILQRALSREMEMQADLVAVSLTGSDALVHALHKLQAADDSWERTLNFAGNEKAEGRPPRDLFVMQDRIRTRMGEILNDPLYGRVPALPECDPQAHRIFKAELAQPPRMWLTHPLNHEREANAKRVYLPAEIDARSAWELFSRPQALREQISAQLMGKTNDPVAADEVSLRNIDEDFDRPSLHSDYRGAYLGRSVVRVATRPSALYTNEAVSIRDLALLYPASLVHDIELQRQLEREQAQLQALQSGALHTADDEIRYRGQSIPRKQLPGLIESVQEDLNNVRSKLQAHDQLCRTVHLVAAREAGQGWEDYVKGLLTVLHYADHAVANVQDLHGMVGHTFGVVTATGKVNDSKLTRLIEVCNELQAAMAKIYVQRRLVQLDVKLLRLLKIDDWASCLGDLGLPQADRTNINEWLKVMNSWVYKTTQLCGGLRGAALDELLATEAMLARHVLDDAPVYAAPAPSVVPPDYDVLPPGQERKRRDKLDWWARFQTADGKVAAAGRFAAAGAIVASVLLMGGAAGTQHVTVYNGLARTVEVHIGPHVETLAPLAHKVMEVDPQGRLHIETRTQDGQLIEAFDAERESKQVYNVAGASPLVMRTVIYGEATPQDDRKLGAQRWFNAYADVMFEDPPSSIQTSKGQRGGTREVLHGLGHLPVQQQMELLDTHADDRDRLVRVHARWDSLDAPDLALWLYFDVKNHAGNNMLTQRLAEAPDSVLLLRLQQDFAPDEPARAAVCARHMAQAAAHPNNADWAYLTVRCEPDKKAKSEAFLNGLQRWPAHPWFGFAAAYVDAEEGRWPQALSGMQEALRVLPAMADSVAEDEARVMRMVKGPGVDLNALTLHSRALKFNLLLEAPGAHEDTTLSPASKAYAALAHGQFVQGYVDIGSDAEAAARWLRLAAASDGAPQDMVLNATKLASSSGVDEASFWSSVGLSMRLHRDLHAFEQLIEAGRVREGLPDKDHQSLQIWRFLMNLQRGGVKAVSDADLNGLPPQQRGFAYSAAVTALGDAAPPIWRDHAKRLLFATERPYFN